jgi:hypothetical protein
MRKEAFIIPMLLFFLIGISDVQAYTIITKVQDDASINHIVNTPSVFWQGSCSVNFFINATSTSTTPYTLSNEWFSPDSISIISGIASYTNNIICVPQGNATANVNLSGFYEIKTKTVSSATTSTNTWVTAYFDCSPDSNNYFLYNNTHLEDSFGNHPYAYGKKFSTCFAQSPSQCINTLTSDTNSVISYLITGYYANCGSNLRIDRQGDYFTVAGCGGIQSDIQENYWQMIPFNSMFTGIVRINMTESAGISIGGGTLLMVHQYYIWDTVTNSTINLGSSYPLGTVQNLVPNRDYWLFIGTRYYKDNFNCGSVITWGIGNNYTKYQINISAYEPNLQCTDYGECIGGTQFRICHDLNGVVNDTYDYRACGIPTPAFEMILGFEDYYTQQIWLCIKLNLTCGQGIVTIDAKYPKGWTTPTLSKEPDSEIGRQNFIRITSEGGATEGTSALKMWYYPPKNEEPIIGIDENDTKCDTQPIGQFPEVDHPYNKTLFISSNISFPSQYMDIRYSVRKCSEPEEQYNYGAGFFSCGFKFYNTENNKSVEPSGIYGMVLSNSANPSEVIFNIAGEGTLEWKDYLIDLSPVNTPIDIETNKNYSLALAVNPSNPFDSRAHCLYFDNVRVTQTTQAINCVSQCQGYDRYTAISTTPCTLSVSYQDPLCVPSNVSSEAQNKEPYCIGTTRFIFNVGLGKWESFENNEICIEEIQQAQAQENLTGINPLIGAILSGADVSQSDIQNSGFGFALTTIFIVFMIDLAISGYIAYKVKHWEAMAITMIGLIIIQTIPPLNVFPLWFSVVFVIFLSLFLAEFILRRYRGG